MRHKDKTEIVDGVAGNARITGMVSVVLLVLLIAEATTIPFIGQLPGPHIFIGMLLLGPLALKLSSTGYRFARYYARTPAYVSDGPPVLGLRLLAPVVVVTTIALFGTGVALLITGPGDGELQFLHKLSFIVWVAFVSVHILGHLFELPRLAPLGTRGGSAGRRRTADPPSRRRGHGRPRPGLPRAFGGRLLVELRERVIMGTTWRLASASPAIRSPAANSTGILRDVASARWTF
jgi:hypothetical protein